MERVDRVVTEAVAAGAIAGLSMIIGVDGAVAYRRDAGWADRESRVPVRSDTIFRFASLTKPVVSAAALALVEQGVLRLEDDVRRWLPSFTPRLADGTCPQITLRHLLTHTSGLTYRGLLPPGSPYDLAEVSDGMGPEIAAAENMRRLASVPLLEPPGTAWRYSLSTDVLGWAMEAATGAGLDQLVKRLVTTPLGLADMAFVVAEPSRVATAYIGTAGPDPTAPLRRMNDPDDLLLGESPFVLSPGRVFSPTAYPCGGGGMAGTAGDYFAFIEAVRQGGGSILSPAMAAAMTSNAVGPLRVSLPPPGWGFGLGVGVLVDPAEAGTPQSAGSWQWGGVYGNNFFVDPARRLSVVVLTNSTPNGLVGPFPEALVAAIYASLT